MAKLPVEGTQFAHLSCIKEPYLREALVNFLEFSATATSKATFYNSQAELNKAYNETHKTLFEIDRGLYTAALALTGATDFTRQAGMYFLLSNPINSNSVLTDEQEFRALELFVKGLPPQRVFKLHKLFKKNHVNNERTKKIFLDYFLNSSSVTYWAIKYRNKIQDMLIHSFGRRTASILKAILAKGHLNLTSKEKSIIGNNILKRITTADSHKRRAILDSVSFVLGNKGPFEASLLKTRIEAETDSNKLKDLPLEVAEGLRGMFFNDSISKDDLLKQLNQKGNLTDTQKKNVQKRAKSANIQVKFDPTSNKFDLVDLFVYGFEQGFNDELNAGIELKATNLAKALPFSYNKVAIVVDGSMSMIGDGTSKNKPISCALAFTEILKRTAVESAKVIHASGYEKDGILHPSGHSNLSDSILTAVEMNPDVVYVISDGYENTPAGRTEEVIRALRSIGNETKIIHLNPVPAAEASGVRKLSKDIPVFSANSAKSLITSSNIMLLETDVVGFMNLMVKNALVNIDGQGRLEK